MFDGRRALGVITGETVPPVSPGSGSSNDVVAAYNAEMVKFDRLDAVAVTILTTAMSESSPFPQIDIIRAVVIVWRVRGKIIWSVLCNIVCNNCAQCDAHTYEQT